jgi:flagellar biosynthesis/type III secretory pathway ATPase
MVRRPINAMDREPVRKPLDTGVRAINAMLTVGRGQRSACSPAPAWASRCCWA